MQLDESSLPSPTSAPSYMYIHIVWTESSVQYAIQHVYMYLQCICYSKCWNAMNQTNRATIPGVESLYIALEDGLCPPASGSQWVAIQWNYPLQH